MDELVPALRRHGLVDRALFASLLEVRPWRKDAILPVARAWDVHISGAADPESTSALDEPTPPTGEPRAL